jgi:1,4-alpha-glucan branching enzyme
MLAKELGSDGVTVAVTFTHPTNGERTASVVGDFNGWDDEAHPMDATAAGWQSTVELVSGGQYRFRYLLDGERWENDLGADAYLPNAFGGDDSIVDLTDATIAAEEAPQRKIRKHQKKAA